MKRYLKRLFKRMRIKLYIKLKNSFRPNISLIDENEKKSSAICRKLISHPNSQFLIAPLSHKRYIRNEPLGMFIVLSDNRINITNHVYNYDVNLTPIVGNKLNDMFDKKVDSQRLEFESEIKSQIRHSLTTILDKLT